MAATDALEEVCRCINARLPGEPFGEQHRLLPLAARMLEESPVAVLLVQRCWCRPPDEQVGHTHMFGRIRLDARTRHGHASRQRGDAAAPPKQCDATVPVADHAAAGDDEEVPLTVYTFTPANAYQLFAHDEARRLCAAPGHARTMDSDDWRAVGAAWEALSVERRTEFDARLRANLQYQNARVLGTRCEYLCSRGSCGLAHCEGCADAMSGHPECYHERLRECGVVFDSAHHYLCPRCLQRHVALARIEPAGPPPSAVVAAIDAAMGVA